MDLLKLIERFLQGVFFGWLFWLVLIGCGIYAVAVSGWVILQNLWPYMLGAAAIWLACRAAWKHHEAVRAAQERPQRIIGEQPAYTRYPRP